MNAWWGNLESCKAEGAFGDWQKMHAERFKITGLPDKKQEAWRYMPMQQLAAVQYASAKKTNFYPCRLLLEHAIVIQCQGREFQVHNGDISGLEVMGLTEAFALYPDECERYMALQAKHEDGFADLNAINFNNGIWLKLREGYQLEVPVIIHHQAQTGVMNHYRHLFILEKNTSMQLIEYFDSPEDSDGSGFINHVSACFLDEYANLAHYRLQQLANHDNLKSSVAIWQEAHSSFHDFLLQLGGKISTCDLRVHLCAIHAKANLAGVFQAKDRQFFQQQVQVIHEQEQGQSAQLYRGVLDDHAKGVFMGEVYVAAHAIKTVAHQSNKNLLLGSGAEMITCPQLQIFADDVVCSHGATVGQLEEDAIFYLQTRGIAEDAAKSFLTKAFYHEPLMTMQHDALRAWCMARLAERGQGCK